MDPRTAPVDLAQLADIGDPEFVREMADLFIETASANLVTIHSAVDRADAGGLSRAAHSLKGASLGMAAHAMTAIAAELEAAGRGERLEDAASLVTQLDAAFAVAKSYLREATTSPAAE
ncbi:MAG: Hpt domain-containing protein [Polyangiaceae bacterium]